MATRLPTLPTDFWAFRLLGGHDDGTVSCGFMGKMLGREARQARPSFSAVVCLAGAGCLHVGSTSHAIAAGQVFFRRCGQPQALEITQAPWRECWISLGGPVEHLWRAAGILDQRMVRPATVTTTWLNELRAITTALQGAPDGDLPHHLLHLQKMLMTLLQDPEPTTDADALDLSRACALLAQPLPTLRQVASECGISYDHFRREFTRRTGLAPGAWRQARLIERARLALHATMRPIADIADELGYANPFAFSAAFSRATGYSPRAWRQRHRR